MTLSLLNIYLIILVVLFIVAIAGISFAIIRSRNKNASTITPPIPDTSHRNEQTRVDQDSSQVIARPDPDEDLSATRNSPE